MKSRSTRSKGKPTGERVNAPRSTGKLDGEAPKPTFDHDPRATGGQQDWRERFAVVPEIRGVGRPTVYNSAFHPTDYLRQSRLGATRAQICATWNIHRDTMNDWSKDRKGKPEFSDAVKVGDELRTAWWENFGQTGAAGAMKFFKQTVYIYLMNNVCKKDYRARVEFTQALDVEDIEW